MKISPNGINLIKHFESCCLRAYPDPKTGGAPWTVGWGATGPDIGPNTVWTQEQADDHLAHDVARREIVVLKHVHVPLEQGQFDAMVSIIFNVGEGSASRDGIIRLKNGQPSTLLKMLNVGNYRGARDQFLRWISPGSAVENGLRRRRQAEVKLFDGLDWKEA